MWIKNKGVGDTTSYQMSWTDNFPTFDAFPPSHLTNPSPGSNTYQRIALFTGADAPTYQIMSNCRDESTHGGSAPMARDNICDGMQHEYGDYTTEVILTGGGVRQADVLSVATASGLLDANRLHTYYAFWPKFASTNLLYNSSGTQALKWYLYSNSSGSFAYIDLTTFKIIVQNGANAPLTSTSSMSWALHDLVEIDLAVGNNGASVCRYRKNGGAWTNLTLATDTHAYSLSSSPLFVMNQGGIGAAVGQGHCWLKQFTVYKATGGPI